MEKRVIIKLIFLIIMIFFIYPKSFIYSNTDSLFSTASEEQIINNSKDYYQQLKQYQWFKAFRIAKVNDLQSGNLIKINLFDTVNFNTKLLMNKRNGIKINEPDIPVTGNLFIKNKKIWGLIHYKNELIRIIPIDPSIHLIALVDKSKLDIEICNVKNDSSCNKKSRQDETQSISDECKIRILVVYTRKAKNDYGGHQGINELIHKQIELTNQTYENSDVKQKLELARTLYIGDFDYETTMDWDIDMMIEGNPFHDNDKIYKYRDIYNADCVVLIGKYSVGYCGSVDDEGGIGATEDKAYCIVNSKAECFEIYAFQHELGHLMGCRHHIDDDGGLEPYPYGHGYCYFTTWYNYHKTIMAAMNPLICARSDWMPYWSNPNILDQGTPTGDEDSYNACVLNNTDVDVIQFRETPTAFAFYYGNETETIEPYQIADLLGRESLDIISDFIAKPNSEVTLRAGDEVILTDGFVAEFGSNVHAFIMKDCDDDPTGWEDYSSPCPNPPEPIINSVNTRGINGEDNLEQNNPNPFNSMTEIKYHLVKPGKVHLTVFNQLGIMVQELVNHHHNRTGKYSVNFNASNLPAGIYYYTLKTREGTITRQMAVVR